METSVQSFKKIHMMLPRDAWDKQKNITVLPPDLSFKHIPNPTYDFYRRHFDVVGRPYGWHLRPRIQDQEFELNVTMVEQVKKEPRLKIFSLIFSPLKRSV